ncbi:MAG: DNA/RNA non-specific endonuclease [Gammaproteobacteria bacterium]|nr:DNA/RNA non-specific endonuclease [Gammaproteobacteria bacterium]MDD9896992.1 DNA/RNA non-specific endonuclease [Gammaproteobacteria bacterium]MDD9958418.1 DNA/RNA non-specific endonuclease [Gammaproteobacteria bacterium]
MSTRILQIVFLSCSLLGAASVHAQNYKIAHCIGGCPLGGSADNHLIIRPIYALSYNTETKSADWVAYKVSTESIGIASSLSRTPLADDYVANTLRPTDFLEAESLGLTRAHYVPLVDFAGSPYWNEVNYLTNAVARTSSLSQGAWYGLDWSIRNLVNRIGAVYVITGPVFNAAGDAKRLLTNTPHRVPDSFFKIVITGEGNAAAFLMAQDSPVHLHHCEMQSSIAEVEALSSLDLFPALSQSPEENIFAQLGCR